MNRLSRRRPTRTRAVALLAAGTVLAALAGCSSAQDPAGSASPSPEGSTQSGPSAAEIEAALSTPTTLKYWSWDLSAQASADAFMKLHPAIKVELTNVGVGPAAYAKVRTALAAGSGVPDVVFMEGSAISSFSLTDSLLDLNEYGAAGLSDLFIPAAWTPAVFGDSVVGLPVGANATASYYRKDLFDKAGLTPPTTWEEFAASAKVLKEKTGASIAAITPNDAGMVYNLIYQAGITPFEWTPGSKDVSISLNSPEMKELMSYWNDLLASGSVSATQGWVDAYWKAFDSDKIATWQAGVWGSPVLAGTTKTSGKWRLAPWPQWTAGENAGSVWQGGTTDVVMKASENPLAAYEFIKFRSTDEAFAAEKYEKWGWDPVLKSALDDPAWLAVSDPFLGDQKANEEVWNDVLADGGQAWRWLPFMEFVTGAYTETLGKAAADGDDLSASLDAWQQKVVDYATQQGFTVK